MHLIYRCLLLARGWEVAVTCLHLCMGILSGDRTALTADWERCDIQLLKNCKWSWCQWHVQILSQAPETKQNTVPSWFAQKWHCWNIQSPLIMSRKHLVFMHRFWLWGFHLHRCPVDTEKLYSLKDHWLLPVWPAGRTWHPRPSSRSQSLGQPHSPAGISRPATGIAASPGSKGAVALIPLFHMWQLKLQSFFQRHQARK